MTSRSSQFLALLAASLLLLAGCGTSYTPTGSTADFIVRTSASDVNTNGQVSLSSLFPNGEPAPVSWSLQDGDNADSLGQGRVDAAGLYTPPNALSKDFVTVHIHAELLNHPSDATTLTLRIHPGFVQPLLPEVATLSAGASMEASAQITEVGAGSVNWSLSSSPASLSPADGLGSLSGEECRHLNLQYTTCKVTYIAPPVLPPAGAVYLVASVNGSAATATSEILLNNHGLNSVPSANQAIQGANAVLGSSGGNDNDYDTYTSRSGKSYIADCCGGTLGALLQDNEKNDYILSNNHVLAESDQARIGDTIDQPGLMDGACTPLSDAASTLHPIGALKAYVPIASRQTNVDAALASVNPGAVAPDGAILQLGKLQNGNVLAAAPPTAGTGEELKPDNLGMQVVKSGRTTGLTCSQIEAIDLAVKVNYFKDCAETQPYYTKTFENQIAIGGNHFTDSGDSGALVLDASNAEPIGLYFAGGTDGKGTELSLVNPIGDVLKELGATIGSNLRVVGSATPHPVACIDYDLPETQPAPQIPQAWRARVQATESSPAMEELSGSGILGTAAGVSLDDATQPALIVYVDRNQPDVAVPAEIGGLRTQVISTTAAAVAHGDAPLRPVPVAGIHLPADVLSHAEKIRARYEAQILSNPSVFGVGVAQSLDQPKEAALLVLLDIQQLPQTMPAVLDGVRLRYMRLQRFHVTRSLEANGPTPPSCAVAGTSALAWKAR
jgi:hypothetical protein